MKKARTVKINVFFMIGVAFLFVIIILKLLYVSVSAKVDGIDLKSFASSRDTVKETIVADRGIIYDKNGEVLARNVNSYTVIAFLSESRTTDPDNPHHVVDKEHTAEVLAPIINMTKERVLELLNYDAYQVELGPGGRGLTELVKEEIEALDLPGIGFISSTKRYYPNADFLSYTLGYAKTDDEGNIAGEFGVELYYNDKLTGKNGYKEYQRDLYGYQIATTYSYTEESIPGNDVYLTIDTNIQMFAEQAVTSLEAVGVEWASVNVLNAKTGEILAVATSPSFNPNIKDITSYYDPLVSYVYEPGSVMKIFSFMAAMENGYYDGEETYKSGTIKVDDAKIKDWNDYGWGTITFNQGFMASSNVAATILSKRLGKEKLKDFYISLGFGKKTGIKLPNELTGRLNFMYATEVASAAFGQGMSITPVQMLQALTCLANEGTIIKPYIISKVVNPSNNKIVYEAERTEVNKVADNETIEKIKDLMRGVVDGRETMSTGKSYYIEGYDIIGKTGTAQIPAASGGYLKGSLNYIRSFAGLFPGDDPEIIVYMAVSKLHNSSALSKAAKTLMEDTATYLNIYDDSELNSNANYQVDSYINKNTEEVVSQLKTDKVKYVLIGDGEKIINQYPKKSSTLITNEKLYLLTNSTSYKYPNLIGWSKLDVTNYSNLINLSVTFNGYGYVTSMNKKAGSEINLSETLELTLEQKYIKEETTEEE